MTQNNAAPFKAVLEATHIDIAINKKQSSMICRWRYQRARLPLSSAPTAAAKVQH